MKKLVTLLLAITLLATLPLLAACSGIDKDLEIRVWTLNGTTGFGMAPLIDKDANGEAELNYTFTVETAATNVRDALINEDADIGALPTNVASALYNSTEGEIVILALNTRGVLYLVTNSTDVPESLSDLAGKTVYCPAQNPTFITKALFDEAEVEVTLDSTTYAEPAALQAAVAAGLVDYAVLPEPMVTIATAAAQKGGRTLTTALNLTDEWDEHFTEGSLVQGCVVARKAFVNEHPKEIAKFLEEYEASIQYVTENPKEASEMIADAEIFANAAVAEKAIPKCNLCFIKGEEMKTAMAAFLETMPLQSIGGALPEDDFYYIKK